MNTEQAIMPQRAILTDRLLKSLKPAPAGKRTVHWDAARSSFGVRITDRGVISFFVLRRMRGKPRPVSVVLGHYPEISLATARKRAVAALSDLEAGVQANQARADDSWEPSATVHGRRNY